MQKVCLSTSLLLLLLLIALTTPLHASEFRVAALQFGTVSWELDVIKHHKLDEKFDYRLAITPVASSNAVNIHLQSGAVDAVVGDWIWVSRQRDQGREFVSFPFSLASGEITVLNDSAIHTVSGLDKKKIGVAGGPHNKNWLIFNAFMEKSRMHDTLRHLNPRFVSPPLLNQLFLNGEFDAAFNFWHYSAKLRSQGMKSLITVKQMMRDLGVEESLPLLMWIFPQQKFDDDFESVLKFLRSSYAAKKILAESDAEWQRIRPLLKVESDSEFLILKQYYRQSIPDRFGNREINAAKNMFDLFRQHGGKHLIGKSTQLNEGTFFQHESIFN